MIKEDFDIINKNMEILVGKEMRKPIRGGSMLDLGFGDMIKKQTRRFDENKEIVMKMVEVSRYAIHISSTFRFICGYDIIINKDYMFTPSNKYIQENKINEDNYDEEKFNIDWDIKGNNAFDETVDKYFPNNEFKFIVKDAKINRFGDLKIIFENGFTFETFTDLNGDYECWRFFEVGSDKHIVISSVGLDKESIEE
ncbi:MAG: hypothetical protein ACK5K7_06635 [Bacilli bacterium]